MRINGMSPRTAPFGHGSETQSADTEPRPEGAVPHHFERRRGSFASPYVPVADRRPTRESGAAQYPRVSGGRTSPIMNRQG